MTPKVTAARILLAFGVGAVVLPTIRFSEKWHPLFRTGMVRILVEYLPFMAYGLIVGCVMIPLPEKKKPTSERWRAFWLITGIYFIGYCFGAIFTPPWE